MIKNAALRRIFYHPSPGSFVYGNKKVTPDMIYLG